MTALLRWGGGRRGWCVVTAAGPGPRHRPPRPLVLHHDSSNLSGGRTSGIFFLSQEMRFLSAPSQNPLRSGQESGALLHCHVSSWFFLTLAHGKGKAGRQLAADLVALLSQVIVQSGRHPTVLQKLCQLPFQYFSDPRLVKVLFPSLIAACYNNGQNKVILEQEMSCILLASFIQVPLCSLPQLLRDLPLLERASAIHTAF